MCYWHVISKSTVKRNIMSSLKDQFKSILKSNCLSESEKSYLKDQFKKFIQNRDFISRVALKQEVQNEDDLQWCANNID